MTGTGGGGGAEGWGRARGLRLVATQILGRKTNWI